MTVTAQFQDRYEAGRFLATKLGHHADDPSLVVLALPRGGVPVGYEVAKALNAPLDVFMVKKLSMPGYDELSVGTVASGGVRILNSEAIHHLGTSENLVDALVLEREQDLQRRERIYRGERRPVEIEGRSVILVDDGLATGANMRAVVRALRERHPSSVTVAVPIGSDDTCHQMTREADEVICALTPDPFYSVGAWYSDFIQITDEEARQLLDHAAHERRARNAQRINSRNLEKITL
jgi:predicted phosphoribosyltransferase